MNPISKIGSVMLVALIFIACQPESEQKIPADIPAKTIVEPEIPATTVATASPTELVRANGSYPVAALEKDSVVLAVIQNGAGSLADFPSIKEGLDHNIQNMKNMAEKACGEGDKPDFLLFHEFPLTGYYPGSRTDKLKFTVQIPGPETDALGEIARACDAYLIFGSYATDNDWPGHILSINAMIGRDGKVVKKFWKARNIKRLYKTTEITTTTIESVRDRYREMYGIEEEFPVVQTEFGNISVTTVQRDPFVFAAYAMRGTEIMLRTATLYAEEDVTSMARANNFYSAMANITMPLGGKYSGGNSIIVGPDAEILARDPSTHEDGIIKAVIPIAEFRKNRTIPHYALDMVMPVFEQYQQEIPINHLDLPREQLPETGEEMKALYDRLSRYLN